MDFTDVLGIEQNEQIKDSAEAVTMHNDRACSYFVRGKDFTWIRGVLIPQGFVEETDFHLVQNRDFGTFVYLDPIKHTEIERHIYDANEEGTILEGECSTRRATRIRLKG